MCYAVKNIETGEYLINDMGVFSKNKAKALSFPTFKRAQKEAKRYNKQMNAFYRLNENDFGFFRGKTCSYYQPCKIER